MENQSGKQLLRIDSLPISIDALLFMVLGASYLWLNLFSSSIVLLLMALYVFIDLICHELPDELEQPRLLHRMALWAKLGSVFLAVGITTIVPTAWNIHLRHITGPESFAHDGLIQIETAVEFLLDGKNPYEENYLGTPMEFWTEVDTSIPRLTSPLHHFAYLPFTMVLAMPFRMIGRAVLGWYDLRMLFLTLYLGVIVLVPVLVSKQRDRLVLLMLLLLVYQFAYFMTSGRNDILILFGLLLTTAFLSRGKLPLAALSLGLTLATKHQAFFFVPFFLAYIMPKPLKASSFIKWLASLWPMFLALAAMIIPFLIWNPRAFYEDTVLYIIGSGQQGFPITGIGLSQLLLQIGVIPSSHAQVPFIWLSLAFSVPAFLFLIRRQLKDNTLANLWLGFALFSFTFQFPSRFFMDNYAILCIQALSVSLLITPTRWNFTELGEAPHVFGSDEHDKESREIGADSQS